jgi:transcriptional regulator with XRE-family HTH domain
LPVDGLEIKIARIRAGVRAYELAHQLGMSESALSRIETGRKQPSPELAARIADALNTAGSPGRVPAA